MNGQTPTQTILIPFEQYLLNSQNKKILWLAAAAVIIQFSIFKYFYPFASFIHGDSFLYLRGAEDNLDINTYMIGYSRFLRLFSVFTRSDFALVTFQYIFIQGSSLFLLFTLFYFYNPNNATKYILLIFFVLNPLLLHLANLVSSDCFFASLSITWFALLLWIIHRPCKNVMIYQSLILFIAFTVRYNALIYPFIAILAFYLSPLSLRKKVAGVSLGVILCILFVGYTSFKYKKLTGHWLYSPFSGWQLSNNAMYSYRYVDSVDRKPVRTEFRALDNMIRQYFDSTRDVKKFPIEQIQASTFYMWSPGLPLMLYKDNFFEKDSSSSNLKKWATMGPLYKSYGLFIIKQYPGHFARYFLWPNALKYYAPPVEFLSTYNSGQDDVTEKARIWFDYKSRKVNTRMKDNKAYSLEFYPILSGIINVVLLFSLVCYLILKGWTINQRFSKGVILAGAIWILNAGFTIFASSPALRFQSFPILLTTIFTFLLIDWMVQLNIKMTETNLKAGENIVNRENSDLTNIMLPHSI